MHPSFIYLNSDGNRLLCDGPSQSWLAIVNVVEIHLFCSLDGVANVGLLVLFGVVSASVVDTVIVVVLELWEEVTKEKTSKSLKCVLASVFFIPFFF